MPSISNWFGTESQPELLGSLIPLKSTSIVAVRNGTPLAAQTVRLETLSGDKQMTGESGRTYSIDAFVLGFFNHPTQPNCNLQAGDTFAVNGVGFEVVALAPGLTDCVQAYLRNRS